MFKRKKVNPIEVTPNALDIVKKNLTTEIYTHVDNSQVRNAVESNPLANL